MNGFPYFRDPHLKHKQHTELMALIASLTAAVAANTVTANRTNELIGIAIERLGATPPATGATEAEQQSIADGVNTSTTLLNDANTALGIRLGV